MSAYEIPEWHPQESTITQIPESQNRTFSKIRQTIARTGLALALLTGIGATAGESLIEPAPVAAETQVDVQGVYDFDGSSVVDLASSEGGKQFATGWGQPGECMVAAQRWITEANGGKDLWNHRTNGVISIYLDSGAKEIGLDSLKPGDVLQRASTGNDFDTNWAKVHTIVFRGYNDDKSIKMVDSNRLRDGKVRVTDSYKLAATDGWEWRAFRFGKNSRPASTPTKEAGVTAISSQLIDGTEHVYWAVGNDGILRETWFKPGEVHTNVIRKFGHAVTALSSQYSPDGLQHVYSGTDDGRLYETWFGQGSNGYQTWEAMHTDAPVLAISSKYLSDGSQHLYWGTQSGRVGETWFKPGAVNSWEAFRSNSPVRALSAQIGADGLQHIYWGNDEGRLHETWVKPGQAVHTNVMAQFPKPILSLDSQTAPDGSQHVYTGDADGKVRESWFLPGVSSYNTWEAANLGSPVKALSSEYPEGGTQHIYSGAGGTLRETWFKPGTVNTWDAAKGPEITAVSDQYIAADGSQHVFWGDASGYAHETWFKPGTVNTWTFPG